MVFTKSTYLGDRPATTKQPSKTDFPLGRPTANPDVDSNQNLTRVREPRERTLQEVLLHRLYPLLFSPSCWQLVGRRPWVGRGPLDTSRMIEKGSFRPLDQVPEPASLKNSVNGSLRSAQTLYLCVLCGSQNKQRLFPYTTLTDWFL